MPGSNTRPRPVSWILLNILTKSYQFLDVHLRQHAKLVKSSSIIRGARDANIRQYRGPWWEALGININTREMFILSDIDVISFSAGSRKMAAEARGGIVGK